MADLSVRATQRGWQRMADALMRSLGGTEACLRMPVQATTAIGEQLGAPSAGFADLPLSPAVFRKVRVPMVKNNEPSYELCVSASCIEAQVSALGLTSADILFAMAIGITVGHEFFLIEETSFTSAAGTACLYRVLLQPADAQLY